AEASVIRLHADDNVVVATRTLQPGETAAGVSAQARVPRGHKLAIRPIPAGEAVRKFGQVIGFASTGIAPGDWVHEHNVVVHAFDRDYRFAEEARAVEPVAAPATFQGYRRADGSVGTRNY